MGVKIKEIVQQVMHVTNPKLHSRQVIAIDAFNWLYSFLSSIRQYDGTPLRRADGQITSHLSGFFHRNLFLLQHRIRPLYIFDGSPPEEKRATVVARVKLRREAEEKAQEARDRGDTEVALKYSRLSSKLEPYMLDDVKELFDAMGIPWLEAPAEGEAQAAHMARKGDVKVVASQDYDCFMFGAPLIIRNLTQQKQFFVRGKSYPVEMQLYKMDEVLSAHGITQEQLVDIGIMVGTDFNDKIPGVGEKTALKLVKDHGSLEAIYEAKPDFEDHLMLDHALEVRKIFLEPTITDDYKIEFGSFKFRDVLEFLCDKNGFNKERVASSLSKLKQELKRKEDMRIDQFLPK